MAERPEDMKRVLQKLEAAPGSPADHLRPDSEWVAGYRDSILRMLPLAGPPERVREVAQLGIEGLDGPMDLRAYRPAAGVLPAIVFFHGGGLVAGSLETHDSTLRALANATGALVVAPEYRRAPEYPFPAAVEDCYAALAHVAGHAEALDIDPARIVVAGDSAGGLLATVAAAMARDRGGPPVAGQVCLYPNTDLRPERDYGSFREFDGAVVKRQELDRCLRLYLAGADPAHPYASPLLAPDLAGLPPALVVTCGHDPLHDEGAAYATRLKEAGVPVQHDDLPGAIHGILAMAGEVAAGRELMARIGGWLRALH